MKFAHMVPSQLSLIDHSLSTNTRRKSVEHRQAPTMAYQPQVPDHQPHSIAFAEKRHTIYATIPGLGIITALDLQTNRTQLLVPRGVICEPTSICFVQGEEDFDEVHDYCDCLYVTDGTGCRIWKIRLGDTMWLDPPELIYQAYRSPSPDLHLQSLADYARDDRSDAAAWARQDRRMRTRGVTVDCARGKMFWLQGGCLMCAPLEKGTDERADERSDVWIVRAGLESWSALSVDLSERWLCLRADTTEKEARLSLVDILPAEEEEEGDDDDDDGQMRDDAETSNEPRVGDWKDSTHGWSRGWSSPGAAARPPHTAYHASIPAT